MNKSLRGTLEIGITCLYALETDVFMFFLFIMGLLLAHHIVFDFSKPFIIGSCLSFVIYLLVKLFNKHNHQNFLTILLSITAYIVFAYLILFIVYLI